MLIPVGREILQNDSNLDSSVHARSEIILYCLALYDQRMSKNVQEVEMGDEFVHVRFRDPDEFDSIRTPDWAAEVAESVSTGAEVRMGQLEDGDEWLVQSVLVKKNVGEDKAREQATKIVEKIESE